jgi:transcriptional regulator with XRE-family HTH domain
MLSHRACGVRIRLLRDQLHWTQEELAKAAGYSTKTIWKAEKGCPLKRQTLTHIAVALGVQFEDIAKAVNEANSSASKASVLEARA